jgi:hypothetical protein
MSVGSHFTILGKDVVFLKRALASADRFRKTKAPFFRIRYRRTQRGFTFWRVS